MKQDLYYECRAPFCVEPVAEWWDVCAICWAYRAHWLAGLPDLWDRAHALLITPRLSAGLQPRISTSAPESRMPLRMAPLSAMSDALVRIELWADTLHRRGAPVDPLPVRGTAREDVIFERAHAVLTEFDHRFEGTGLTGDYYLSLYEAYWRLNKLDRNRLAIVRLAAPCPTCETRGLLERHAGEMVMCLTCGSNWSQSAFSLVISPSDTSA